MTGPSKNARLTPRSQITFRPIEQGALLVDLNSGSCFRLNQVGAMLWTRLAAGETIGAAISAVQGQYNVPVDVVTKDALRLCGELLAAGLVERTDDDERL